jgi:rubrerythrin
VSVEVVGPDGDGMRGASVSVEVVGPDGDGMRGASAGRRSTAGFRRRALFGGAGVLFGGVLIAGLPRLATSAPSPDQDLEVLNFVLELERLQEAFYAEALGSLSLAGEWREFARVVGGHERAHREFIEEALGDAARPPPQFDFADALRDSASFEAAAVTLEETAVATYNGQATNLTPKGLAAAARIASVEARHASWARDLAGKQPAPRGSDRAIGAERAQTELSQEGLVQ